jgi:integrase/recombinase XerD
VSFRAKRGTCSAVFHGQNGIPLEEVSRALGHDSIKTTEKYYAKWVKMRQDRLDDLIAGTWSTQRKELI